MDGRGFKGVERACECSCEMDVLVQALICDAAPNSKIGNAGSTRRAGRPIPSSKPHAPSRQKTQDSHCPQQGIPRTVVKGEAEEGRSSGSAVVAALVAVVLVEIIKKG
jgi:hypothetical protein